MPYDSLVSRADAAALIPEDVSTSMLKGLTNEQQRLAVAPDGETQEQRKERQKALRYEVAAANDLPLKWAERLRGSTKEELAADAEELAKELAPGNGGLDGGARRSAPTGGSMDERIRAAARR